MALNHLLPTYKRTRWYITVLSRVEVRYAIIKELDEVTNWFKGVLHPRLVFGLFLHFSQKLQHIGDK